MTTKRIDTPNFTVEVDTQAMRGWFEHNKLGEDCAGGLWFELLAGGIVALSDYDGVFELPAEVKQTLTDNGFFVSEEY